MSASRKFAKWFSNYDNPKSPASRLRKKRIAPLLNMVESIYKNKGSVSIYKNKGSVSIIDLGGTEKYWRIIPSQYLKEYNAHVTIVNLPGSGLPRSNEEFSFIESDACNLT